MRSGGAAGAMPKLVSATTFDVDGEVRCMVRPQLPNYALRRFVVGTAAVVALMFGLVASVGVLAGVSGGGTASAAAPSQAVAAAPTVHVAQPGDTMWSIASTYRGDVDHGRYIDALIDINGGAGVQAGSAVVLP